MQTVDLPTRYGIATFRVEPNDTSITSFKRESEGNTFILPAAMYRHEIFAAWLAFDLWRKANPIPAKER